MTELDHPDKSEPAKSAVSGSKSRFAIAARSLLSIALLATGVVGFLLLGKAEPPVQAPRNVAVSQVDIVLAAEHEEGLTFSVDGVVRPYRDLQVAAESGGRVVSKAANCRVGKLVAAGDALIQIDPRDYQLEIRRLEEELEQATISASELGVQIESAYQQIDLAEQAVEINERQLARFVRVRSPGAVTEAEIDSTKREVVNARISLQSQSDQLRSLEASLPRLKSVVDRTETQLAMARLALERCVIRAPIDGVITEEHVEQDGYLQKGALVFTVRDTSRLDVRCDLRADQLALLWDVGRKGSTTAYEFPETPVNVIYELGTRKYSWQGALARFDGAGLDSQTRMAPCLVHVEDPRSVTAINKDGLVSQSPPPTLLVGMFVEVQVRLRPETELVSIPITALQPGNRVWVVDGGELHSRSARVAEIAGDSVLVYVEPGGLSVGEKVVVSPLASPEEGVRVRLGDPS